MGNKPGRRRQAFKWHGNGVLSKVHADRLGKLVRVFYIRYSHKGQRYLEQAGLKESEARRRLAAVEAERRAAKLTNRPWIPPAKLKRQQEAAEQALERTRELLIFEAARDRFLKRHGDGYADRKDVEGLFRQLDLVFRGRYLDEVTRADVQGYIDDRLASCGPFKRRGKVGLRSPQREIAALSRLYGFLIDEEGHEDLRNPCERAWRRRLARKRESYRPAHRAVIPTREQREAIFAAAAWARKPREEHADPDVKTSPDFRAFVRLCYYTAARPESEACTLQHGDVELPDREKVSAIAGDEVLGAITFRDTKTGVSRTVPLHRDLEDELREVMLPEPEEDSKLQAWRERPIFRRRDGKPWNQYSYRRLWANALATVSREHPTLAGMWLRDLRKAAITDMRGAGTDSAIASKLAGHSTAMSDHYTQATTPAMVAAIQSLGR